MKETQCLKVTWSPELPNRKKKKGRKIGKIWIDKSNTYKNERVLNGGRIEERVQVEKLWVLTGNTGAHVQKKKKKKMSDTEF